MMTQEARTCNKCGYEVTYCWISDAHDPESVTQFVAVIFRGKSKGVPAVTDHCPKCGRKLTLGSTTAKNPKPVAPKPKPDYCGPDCERREKRPRDIDHPTPAEQKELESEIFSALEARGFHLLCLMKHLDNIGRSKRPPVVWGDGLMKSTVLRLCSEGRITGDYFGILRPR